MVFFWKYIILFYSNFSKIIYIFVFNICVFFVLYFGVGYNYCYGGLSINLVLWIFFLVLLFENNMLVVLFFFVVFY